MSSFRDSHVITMTILAFILSRKIALSIERWAHYNLMGILLCSMLYNFFFFPFSITNFKIFCILTYIINIFTKKKLLPLFLKHSMLSSWILSVLLTVWPFPKVTGPSQSVPVVFLFRFPPQSNPGKREADRWWKIQMIRNLPFVLKLGLNAMII